MATTIIESPSADISKQKSRAKEIAAKYKLNKEKSDRFVKFLIEWGKLDDSDWTWDRHYAGEWAQRFLNEEEYSYADDIAMQALVNIDGMENAVKRLTKELDDYNGYKESHKKEARDRINAALPETVKGHKTSKPHKKCICNAAQRMIGKLPEIKGKNFL